MSTNVVVISGNLGADPILKTLSNGSVVCNLNVAVNEGYTDANGIRHESVTWVQVAVWGPQAKACADYKRKGHAVTVTGTIEAPRAWIDQQGVPHAQAAVRAVSVDFGSAPVARQTAQPQGITFKDRSPQVAPVESYADADDGLPPN